LQNWSEPVRSPTGADIDRIRRDERDQTKADQAKRAGATRVAAKKRERRELLALVEEDARAGAKPKLLLARVNDHCRKLGRKEIPDSTFRRWLGELKNQP
jgi:hypothetical protein